MVLVLRKKTKGLLIFNMSKKPTPNLSIGRGSGQLVLAHTRTRMHVICWHRPARMLR